MAVPPPPPPLPGIFTTTFLETKQRPGRKLAFEMIELNEKFIASTNLV